MKCAVCEQEASSGSLMFGFGFICSEDCGQIAKGRRDAFHNELLAEDLGAMPEALTTGDFERWSLKLALHMLKGMTPKQRKKIAKNNPLVLIPDQLALDLKERILRHINRAYVSETEIKGHARMFCTGEYMFRQPVPSEHIVEACKKAEVLS